MNSPDIVLERLTEFCGLFPFKYTYQKDGKLHNSENFDRKGWEILTVKSLGDPNKKYDETSKIEKQIFSELKKLEYI